MNYKILVVDENSDQIEGFETFLDNIKQQGLTDKTFEVFGLTSISDEGELFQFIISNEIDCVAFDYKLMENNSSFSQQGDVFQMHLLEHFEEFPTFIITNNADDYKLMKADPFKIISKAIINFNSDNKDEVNQAIKTINNISQLIDRYKENLKSNEDAFFELTDRQSKGEKLNDKDLARLVDLDTKLESSISKKSKLPKDWKSPADIDNLTKLVSETEGILNELKKLKND